MNNTIRLGIGLGLYLGISGCNAVFQTACTDEARPYLGVEVRDARTGAPAALGARGSVQEGSFTDTLQVNNGLVMQAAGFERPGTYTVRIQKAGYQDWTAQDVRVKQGPCHVETVTLRARLELAS